MIARLRSLPFRARIVLLAAAGIVPSAALAAMGPIPQDPAYHAFADGRTILGIPNFGDVVTNLPFVILGLLGAALARKAVFRDPAERRILAAVFGALALTGIGSAWYHWAPDNARLVWDRAPLAAMLAGFLALTAAERIDARGGARWALPLMAFGAGSAFYWGWTESRGAGDLRLYAMAQFLAIALALLAAILFPPKYSRTGDLLLAAAAYAGAKAAEALDRPILELTGLVSGHTLKHLLAAAAAAILLSMILRRRPCPPADPLPRHPPPGEGPGAAIDAQVPGRKGRGRPAGLSGS